MVWAVRVRSASISVVGNLTTDLVIHGLSDAPAWGEERAGHGHRSDPGGQAVHVALGLSKLGTSVRVIGVVGDDAEGAQILHCLSSADVDVSGVAVSDEAGTSITVALVRSDGERAFVSDFACQRVVDASFVERKLDGLADVGSAVCLVGLFNLPELSPDDAAVFFAAGRRRGVVTVLDTGWDPNQWSGDTVAATFRLLSHTDLFLPNLAEASALTGETDPEAAAIALEQSGAGIVVVKCGADGCVARVGGATSRSRGLEVTVHDAIGAGDVFDAAFLHAHLRGWPLDRCMAFGNAAAALRVSRTTERHATEDDVTAFMLEATS